MEDKNRFPTGMRVLAVDDNSTCLIILEALLRSCQYNVTTAKEATTALQILREKENEIDLVMSEVDLPGMDGFRLLEEVSRQTDIPVVLVSWDDNKEGVMKGVANGACDYLLKPVRMEELKNIWQHVVRRKLRKNNNNNNNCNNCCCRELTTPVHHVDQMPPSNTCTDSKKRKDDEIKEEVEYDHESGQQQQQKKPRVVWLPDLHRKFVAAVDQLGVDKAVPKRILELMDVEGITRENVASHLQKYRVSLKKSSKGQANIMFAKFGSAYYGDQIDNRQQIIRGGSTSRRCASYPASMLGSRLNNPHQENYSSHHWGRHSDYSNNNLMHAINDHDEADNIHYSIHTTMNEQTSSTSLLLLHGGNQMPMPIPSRDDFSINCCGDSNNNSVVLEVEQHLSNATAMQLNAADHPLTDQRRYDHNNNDNSEWPPSAAIRVHLPSDTSSSADDHLAIIAHQIQVQHHGASYNYSTTPLCQNIIRREFPKDSSSPVQSSYDHCMNSTQSHQSNIPQNHLKQPSIEELQQ